MYKYSKARFVRPSVYAYRWIGTLTFKFCLSTHLQDCLITPPPRFLKRDYKRVPSTERYVSESSPRNLPTPPLSALVISLLWSYRASQLSPGCVVFRSTYAAIQTLNSWSCHQQLQHDPMYIVSKQRRIYSVVLCTIYSVVFVHFNPVYVVFSFPFSSIIGRSEERRRVSSVLP